MKSVTTVEMSKAERDEILAKICIATPTGIDDNGSYVRWWQGRDIITLDDYFTPKELIAIAMHVMENEVENNDN